MLSVLQGYCLFRSEILQDTSFQSPPQIGMGEHSKNVKEYMKDYELSAETYAQISAKLLEHMNKGLGAKSNAEASVKMYPTYVRSLPDGTERGKFLALDLGGTNFRVLLITLPPSDGSKVQMINKIYPISEAIMLGPGDGLFDYIAQSIADFLKDQGLLNEEFHLGFTFSFPCKQEGLAVGRLVKWTKGFRCEGVEGEDVVALLHKAIKKRGDIKVTCVAILNDTVGCLMSCAFEDHDCKVGVILGTGTNACYMENLKNVEIWDEDKNEPAQVVINTEWGAFGEKQELEFIRTHADKEVDSHSLNAGEHLYEKMISGMYMGEIARLCIVDLAKKGHLFKGKITKKMDTHQDFQTKFISEIEVDDASKGDFKNTRGILEELGYEPEEISSEDLSNVHYICHTVGLRAAQLSAAGIATLINRINVAKCTVAVDGSLYRFHPLFHDMMSDQIKSMLKPGLQFKLMLSEDGSGKGAALVAAVSCRLLRDSKKQ